MLEDLGEPCSLFTRAFWFGVVSLGLCSVASALAEGATNTVFSRRLTLQDLVGRVVEQNESIQMKMLEAEISRKTLQAEKGIFEPAVVGSVEHLDTDRPNNAQQQRSLLTSELIERNTLYDGGLEFLSPIGSRFKLGVSLRDLRNNIQKQGSILGGGTNGINGEYESFIGVSVTQPLLKNFGVSATSVRIRLAAAASDLAFQDYRRQLMLTVARAESAYWDLYLTQEQERISQESVETAQVITTDNENRLKVGRSSELELLQAQAGLSLRRARLGESRTKRIEGGTQIATLLSEPGFMTNVTVEAVDRPVVREVPMSYFESYQLAYQLNPDYLSRKIQITQETIRLGYARNQRLPLLDFKANYGFNGLGQTPGGAWDDISRADFPTWSVGVEMRIPVTGGIRERNELEAAQLARQRALLGLREIEIQISNALDSSAYKTRSYLDNVQSYQSVVEFHEQLLKSQVERMKVGRLDTLTVLQTEEKLFEARIAALENLVQYQKAFLELELVTGATLQVRNLDTTKPQLQAKTAAQLKDRFSEVALEKYAREAAKNYYEDLSPSSLASRKALDVLHKEIQTQDIEAQRKALELLRQRVDQLQSPRPVQPAPETPTPTLDSASHSRALELLRETINEQAGPKAAPAQAQPQ